eukprot:scaffold217579_cov30-Cyclotella_meneghiniana.AAC.1
MSGTAFMHRPISHLRQDVAPAVSASSDSVLFVVLCLIGSKKDSISPNEGLELAGEAAASLAGAGNG